MTDDTNSPPRLEDSKVVRLSGEIMVISVIVLFIVVTIVLITHIYARLHWSRSHFTTANTHRSSTITTNQRRGLDTTSLESLPIITYHLKDSNNSTSVECAVCLSEAEEGEKMRVLPNCNHGFHVDCIDMWFQSHSTCPLCRNPVMMAVVTNGGRSDSIRIDVGEDSSVDNESSPSSNDDGHDSRVVLDESLAFPPNVLVWGNQTQVNSGAGMCLEGGQEQVVDANSSSSVPSDVVSSDDGGQGGRETLVIDIPKRVILPAAESCSSTSMGMISSNTDHYDGEDMKSPTTPMSARLKTLKRLWSRGKKVVIAPSTCTSSSGSSESAIGSVHHQVEQV